MAVTLPLPYRLNIQKYAWFICPLELNPISSKTKGDQQEHSADLLCIYYLYS